MTRRSLLAALLVVSACVMGPRTSRVGPVREPRGTLAEVRRGRAQFTAELLAVTDTALLVVRMPARRVALVPYGSITRVRFPELPSSYALRGAAKRADGSPEARIPAPELREELRLWSRYPHVSAELLARLLQAYGQDSLEVLPLCSARDC